MISLGKSFSKYLIKKFINKIIHISIYNIEITTAVKINNVNEEY